MFRYFTRALTVLNLREKTQFFGYIAFRVLINVLDVAGVALVGVLTAQLAGGFDAENSNIERISAELPLGLLYSPSIILTLIIVAFLAKALLSAVGLWLLLGILSRAEARLATEVSTYLFSGDLGRLRNYGAGDFHWATHFSPQQAVRGVLASSAILVTETSLFLMVFLLFLLVNPVLSLLVTGYLLAVGILIQLFSRKKLNEISEQIVSSSKGIADSLGELSESFREIRVFGATRFFIRRFAQSRGEFASAVARQTFFYALPRLTLEAALYLGLGLLLAVYVTFEGVGGALPTLSVLLAGGLKMLVVSYPLQNEISNLRVAGPQSETAVETFHKRRAGLLARSKLLEPSLGEGRKKKTPVKGLPIVVSRMGFAYPGSESATFEDVNLRVRAGSLVAVIGSSGAGKTTLANLLLGLEKPSQGSVLIGGHPPEALAERTGGGLAYVPQEPTLFTGTLIANITMGNDNYPGDTSRIIKVLKLAQLEEFVSSLPDGIETMISKGTSQLSGGQKQRIGLARALYRNPRLIVLDEFTSALDSQLEVKLSNLLRDLVPESTVVAIAHRYSTVAAADTVIRVGDKTVRQYDGGFSNPALRELL